MGDDWSPRSVTISSTACMSKDGTMNHYIMQVSTGEVTQIGKPRLYTSFAPSPDAKFLLLAWLERPYSYTMPCGRFPKRVQLWDRSVNFAILSLQSHH